LSSSLQIQKSAVLHGHERCQGFTVSQVVMDYGDVSPVTGLAVELSALISTDDFDLNRCLDDALPGPSSMGST
jgi:hypothetical protein